MRCWVVYIGRLVGVGLLCSSTIAALVCGGFHLEPGFTEAFAPTNWFMGAASIAHVVSLVALFATSRVALVGFYQVGLWGVLAAGVGLFLVTAGYCGVSVSANRRVSPWPVLWLAVLAIWAARVVLECDVSMLGENSTKLDFKRLSMCLYLWSGGLAGCSLVPLPRGGAGGAGGGLARGPALLARPGEDGVGDISGCRLRCRQACRAGMQRVWPLWQLWLRIGPRCFHILQALVGFIGAVVGVALALLRDDGPWVAVEAQRVAAAALMCAGATGCAALWLSHNGCTALAI